MSEQERIIDLLLKWTEIEDEKLTPEELCRQEGCPELAPKLNLAIASRDRFDEKFGVTNDDATWDLCPEDLMGRYRLIGPLGYGGHSVVYRGWDLALQRPVAVKLRRADKTTDSKALLAEARRAAKLQHPGIVPVFDVGEANGRMFIVSDLIEGKDLRRQLDTGPLLIDEVLRVGADVAEAIAHAHQAGYLHMDLKPANLLMSDTGRIMVCDFGVSVLLQDLVERKQWNYGTPVYSAPEVHHGDPNRIDFRADLYSLGATLYELIAREPPFTARDPEVLKSSIFHKEPPAPSLLNPDCPKELDRLVLKCLAKSPVNRFSSAQQLQHELRSLRASLKNRVTGKRGNSNKMWMLHGLILWMGCMFCLVAAVLPIQIHRDRETAQTDTAAKDKEGAKPKESDMQNERQAGPNPGNKSEPPPSQGVPSSGSGSNENGGSKPAFYEEFRLNPEHLESFQQIKTSLAKHLRFIADCVDGQDKTLQSNRKN